jgi:hypothetical protein
MSAHGWQKIAGSTNDGDGALRQPNANAQRFRIDVVFSDGCTSLSLRQLFGDHNNGVCGQMLVGIGGLLTAILSRNFHGSLLLAAMAQNGDVGVAADLSLPMTSYIAGKRGMQYLGA